MTRRLELIACALLVTVGTAAADDAPKESMAMHQKMLDDCMAKQDPAADKHAAMKGCIDMLDKQMAGKEMSDKHAPGAHVYDEGASSHPMPHDDHMPHAGAPHNAMPHDEAGKGAPSK